MNTGANWNNRGPRDKGKKSKKSKQDNQKEAED